MATILKSKTMVAKKRHWCEWCGKHIEPGETYDYEAQIFEGDFVTMKAHTSCNRLIQKLWAAGDYNDDEGIAPYEFQDIVRDEWRDAHDKGATATWPDMLEWCKEKYGVSDRLDRQYFADEDAERCYSLKYHLDKARAEGLTEVTLMEAIHDIDVPADVIFCTVSGETGERCECGKHLCDDYKPRGKAKGGPCAHRGHFYEHGEKKTFKVE
jgi:hypothetical protein